MITIKFNDGGAMTALDVMADSFDELAPVMAKFSKYMRKEVDAVFSSQGNGEWPERSESSEAHVEASKQGQVAAIEAGRYNSLVGSIRSSQRKVQRKLAKTPQSNSKLTASRRKSIDRYEAQVAEIQRILGGGERTPKGNKKLYERVERRDDRAAAKIEAVERGDLLGQIAHSLEVDWTKTLWVMESRIPWAGAHNEGATVGHRATLPARTFLTWTPERVAKFAELVQEHLVAKFKKGTGAKT